MVCSSFLTAWRWSTACVFDDLIAASARVELDAFPAGTDFAATVSAIDPAETAGKRITDMRLNGKDIDPSKTYKVAGWAPVSEEARNIGGEPIWDVIERHLRDVKVVKAVKLNEPNIKGVKNNPGMVSL